MAAGDIHTRAGVYHPKKAVVCDGADDAVQVDAWGTDRQTASDTVGTISGWICTDALTASYCLLSAGDTDGDEFIWFGLTNGLLHLEVSDAGTTDIDLESDAIHVPPHEWHHIAIVQDGLSPVLYCDGVKVAATFDVDVDRTSWFDQMSSLDNANIGYLEANNTLTLDMNGGIGQISHWNLALTAAEVMSDYTTGVPEMDSVDATRVAAVAAARISRWEFDGGFTDSWAGANNGAAVNQAFVDPEYSVMTSKLRALTVVVADDISVSSANGVLYAVVVKAA